MKSQQERMAELRGIVASWSLTIIVIGLVAFWLFHPRPQEAVPDPVISSVLSEEPNAQGKATASTAPSPGFGQESYGNLSHDRLTPERHHDRFVAWLASFPELAEAEEESLSAIDPTIAKLEEWFAEQRARAMPIAEELVGMGGKLEYAGVFARQVEDSLSRAISALKNEPFMPWPTPEEQFAESIELRLNTQALPFDELRQEIDDAWDGYTARLHELESRLVVASGADLPDEAIAWDLLPQERRWLGVAYSSFRSTAADIARACGAAFGVTVGREGVSWLAGDLLGSWVAGKGASALQSFTTNIASGIAVDHALNGVISATGYDPVREIETLIARAIDTSRALTIEGDPGAVEAYRNLRRAWLGYPDMQVRAECRQAMNAMEASPNCPLGLRVGMERLHFERAQARLALFHMIKFGPDVAVPMPSFVNPAESAPPEEIIAFARRCAVAYGTLKGEN